MAITSKNCLVSHVLTFDKGELVGGYIEDCDLFIDCYGVVLGSSEIHRSAIPPKHLGSIAILLELAYEEDTEQPVEVEVAPEEVAKPVEVAPEIWGAATATEIAKDVIAVAPVVAVVAVAPEAPVALEPLVAPLPAPELPVVPLDTIVLPTATEASPVVLAPVKALPDVVVTPEATFVVPAQSVPEDVKPETKPATIEPTSEPVAVVAPSKPSGVVEVATVDPQVPPVAADGLNQAQAVLGSDVANVAQTPATIETKTTDNLNDTDNELSLKAFL